MFVYYEQETEMFTVTSWKGSISRLLHFEHVCTFLTVPVKFYGLAIQNLLHLESNHSTIEQLTNSNPTSVCQAFRTPRASPHSYQGRSSR